jgi:Na+-transporting methylmalonyl-CoA/oxaloacetate decarboxylase beta subunit
MEDIKKAIIGVITLAITTAGGLLINKLINGEDKKTVKTEKVTPTAQPNVIINIPQQEVKKDTVVKKVYVKPKPKLSETEKRKKKIDW